MFLYFAKDILIPIIIILSLKYVHSNVHPWNEDFYVKHMLCKTDECLRHASYIGKLLNRDVNPCNDFYDFVCNKWEMEHPVPPSYPEWRVDNELEELAFHRLQNILEEEVTRNESPELKKAKQLYKECTAIPDLGMINNTEMRTHVEAAGYFPLVVSSLEACCKESWIKVHNYYLSLTGESALFTIHSSVDIRYGFNSLLQVSEIVSPYGLIKMTKRLPFGSKRSYYVFLATAVSRVISAKHELPYVIIEERLADVFQFRDALMMTLSLRTTNEYNLMTVKEFAHWYNRGVNPSMEKGRIPWIEVISALYNDTRSLDDIKSMSINVKNKVYFRSLARLLAETPNNVLVNHIHLYFIERHLELDSYLHKMLLDVIIKDGKLQGYLDYAGKKWQACIVCNSMRHVLGKVYVQKYLPVSTREKIDTMMTNLQNMMAVHIADSTWLDDTAREEAQLLINNLKVTIDFEQDNTTEEITESQSICLEGGIVDVFYSYSLNIISISAAYFEPPIYSPMLPFTFTYGSMGSILGHEMYHVLEPLFSHYAPSYKHTCCSRKIVNTYESKTKCFFKQFDKVHVKELEHIKPAPKIDGQRTLKENIADTMGLKLAYQTFRKRMWEKKICHVLPNLPNINCEQMFFISFASSFCASINVDKMLEDLEDDEHSTARLRVNGAVSNMKEFSKVFQCPENAPMNPRHKCNLWE